MYKASKQFNTSRECRKHKNTHSIWMADFFNLKDFLHHPENFWGNDMITAAKIAVIRKNILRECWQQLLTMFTSKFVDGYFLVQFYKSINSQLICYGFFTVSSPFYFSDLVCPHSCSKPMFIWQCILSIPPTKTVTYGQCMFSCF